MKQQYRIIARIFSENKAVFAVFFFLSSVLSGLSLLVPYLSKLQIDQLENRLGGFGGVVGVHPELVFILIVVLFLVVNIASNLLGTVVDIYNQKIYYGCSSRLERELFRSVERFDAGFMQNPRNCRIVSSSMNATGLVSGLSDFVTNQIRIVMTVFGILPVVAYFSPGIFLVLLVSGAVQMLIIGRETKSEILMNAVRSRWESRFAQLQNLVFYESYSIAHVDDSDFVMKKYWDLRRKNYELGRKWAKARGKYSLFESLAENLAFAATSVFAGLQVIGGYMSVGEFVMLTLYAGMLQNVIWSVIMIIPKYGALVIDLNKLEFFMQLKSRFKEGKGEKTLAPFAGDIRLHDVSFSYPNFQKEECEYIESIIRREKRQRESSAYFWDADEMSEWQELLRQKGGRMPAVLRHVSAEFKRGEITALVGRNGSGKTTLANLIARSYDPKRGRVTIGGIDLVSGEPHHIKKYIGIIPQEPFLLGSFSIRENIAFGRDDAGTEKRIWGVLDLLGLKQAIFRLPGKLDAMIGDDVRFSGGQSQLLSIARVLIQDRPIVIFDEGTNQLDAEHEAKIMDVLESIKRDKTIIMITHRMTTARKADRIIVMDEGRIVESGKHSELVKDKAGLYKKFWDLQTAGGRKSGKKAALVGK